MAVLQTGFSRRCHFVFEGYGHELEHMEEPRCGRLFYVGILLRSATDLPYDILISVKAGTVEDMAVFILRALLRDDPYDHNEPRAFKRICLCTVLK